MRISIIRTVCLLLSCCLALGASADALTWTGAAGDGVFSTAGNWSPAVTPQNNNYKHQVTFNAGAGTVKIDTAYTVSMMTIKTPGWTFTGSEMKAKGLTISPDCGTITANAYGLTDANGNGYSIGSGTTLLVKNGFTIQNTSTPTLKGGGTLHLQSRFSFNYYSDGGAFVIQNDSLLITDQKLDSFASTRDQNAWTIKLASRNARFRCKSTLAEVKARFETSIKNTWNLACAYDTTNQRLAAREVEDGYVEVYLESAGTPVIESADLTRTEGGAYRVTTRLSQGTDETVVKALADDGNGAVVETVYAGAMAVGEDLSFDLANLAEGTTYTVKVVAENTAGTTEKAVPVVFYNGTLALTLTTDAQERDTVPGVVTVSRAQAGAALTVNYAFAGVTAVEGTDYAAPTGTVTIPEGATSAEILVQPIMNAARQEDTTLDVSLESGLYAASAAPVRVTIHDFTIPSDACVWMGGVDNKASTAANWYQEKLPTRNDKILLAAFSSANLVWDAGVNDLPDTVAAWEQTVDYTGTVTFATTYPEQGAFTVFTVTGDCAVNGGAWTHLANEALPINRLCVAVGGSFTLGESASIDVSAKGYGPGQCAPGGDQGVHGGSRGDPAKLRGSWLAPTELGAGGASNRRGGGALWLEVARAAVIDGAIHADSSSVTAQSTAAAGGSVYLQAASVTGAGSISADALPRRYDLYGNPGGSGGRIAIVVTEAEVCGLSDAKLTAYGMWGGPAAGAGTIRIKTASHTHDGKLLVASNGGVQSYGTRRPRKTETTVVTPGETWTLDELKFREEGVLGVPAGARLVLPNGAVSVSAVSERTSGLIALGGEIDFGAGDQTFQKNWIFQADTPYNFDCNVTVTDGAAIGCLPFAGGVATGLASEYAVCDVTVTKNLTVTLTGFLSANNGGPNYPYNHEYQSSHGGQSREYETNLAYDSVFNPTRPGKGNTGGDQGRSFAGGGALLVTVGETLTLDGVASANSTDSKEGRAASGGTLNIRAKRLAGTGRGSASASFGTWTASSGFGGGGGRIAVRVTETPLEGATVWRNFKATGAALNGTAFASAGTVYLETGAQGENGGTIYVHNGGPCAAWTALPSRKAGGEVDVYTKANLEISDNGAVKLFESLKLSSLTMTASSKLDLNGQTLSVRRAKVGGAKLKPGTYTFADAASADPVTDSSVEKSGKLTVTGGGFAVFVL